MFNTVVLSGTIISDLIRKETDKGSTYVNFQVQTINEYNQKTTNIPVVAWNKTAQNVINYGSVGKQVIVRGVLVQYRSYNVSRFDVSADSVVFLDGKSDQFEELRELQDEKERKREEATAQRTEAWMAAEKERLESE